MQLYPIKREWHRLSFIADDLSEEQAIQELKRLNNKTARFVADAIAAYKNLRAQEQAVMHAIKDQQNLLTLVRGRIEAIKGEVLEALDLGDLEMVRCDHGLAYSTATPGRVVIDDEEMAMKAKRFVRVKKESDKKAISEHLKSGKKLKFAHLEFGKAVVIK